MRLPRSVGSTARAKCWSAVKGVGSSSRRRTSGRPSSVLAWAPGRGRSPAQKAEAHPRPAAQVGVTLTSLEVSVSSESDSRGMLGTDDGVSAGLLDLRTHVKIGAEGATPDQLQEIVQWGDAHSRVGGTIRRPQDNTIDIEVVR